MGLDASRDEGANPSGSHRTAQALTRIIPSNFAGEYCFAISRIDSQCVQSGSWRSWLRIPVLSVRYICFPSEHAWLSREARITVGVYPAPQFDTAINRRRFTQSVVWSGREDLNLRHPAPKAGALPGCATPRRALHFFILGETTPQFTDPFIQECSNRCPGNAYIRTMCQYDTAQSFPAANGRRISAMARNALARWLIRFFS